MENQESKLITQNATKIIDFTAIADRLRTDS